jgi:hypothetical protein
MEANMKNTYAVALGMALIILPAGATSAGEIESQARYKNIDMEQVTCRDLLEEKDIRKAQTALIWLDGYVSAQAGDHIIDLYDLENLPGQLEAYCRENPSALIKNVLKTKKQKPGRALP